RPFRPGGRLPQPRTGSQRRQRPGASQPGSLQLRSAALPRGHRSVRRGGQARSVTADGSRRAHRSGEGTDRTVAAVTDTDESARSAPAGLTPERGDELPFLRGAVTSQPAYRFEHHPQRIKLDQNEAPDNPAPDLLNAALERLASAGYNRYADLHPATLEAALARRHDWPAAGVVVANGSNVLIQALVILGGIGRSVVTVKPNFAVYASQARLLGAETHEVPLEDGFGLPTAALLATLRSGRG